MLETCLNEPSKKRAVRGLARDGSEDNCAKYHPVVTRNVRIDESDELELD